MRKAYFPPTSTTVRMEKLSSLCLKEPGGQKQVILMILAAFPHPYINTNFTGNQQYNYPIKDDNFSLSPTLPTPTSSKTRNRKVCVEFSKDNN